MHGRYLSYRGLESRIEKAFMAVGFRLEPIAWQTILGEIFPEIYLGDDVVYPTPTKRPKPKQSPTKTHGVIGLDLVEIEGDGEGESGEN
jgi:hypothetical protein